ncbi:hypothetical protein OC844_003248 [Tilletia horrida]|nr:hypothetical protein OC844_003248 [Tilletia horrida]
MTPLDKVEMPPPKRRKITTCLPCKKRKVKCDKERPHCGQCKRQNIADADCVWVSPQEAAEADAGVGVGASHGDGWDAGGADSSLSWYIGADGPPSSVPTPAAAQGSHAHKGRARASLPPSAHASGSRVGMGMGDAPVPVSAMLNPPTAHLGQEDGATPLRASSGVTFSASHPEASPHTSTQERSRTGSASAPVTAGEPASDRPAAAATHTSLVSASALQIACQSSEQVKNWSQSEVPHTSLPFPFNFRHPTRAAVLDALQLFPTREETVASLLLRFREIDRCVFGHGITWRLIYEQLEEFNHRLRTWRAKRKQRTGPGSVAKEAGQAYDDDALLRGLDLSFVALLFALLTAAALHLSPTVLVSERIIKRVEEHKSVIHVWQETARVLLDLHNHQRNPNLNVLIFFVVSRQYHFFKNQNREVLANHAVTVALAQVMGLHRLGSAREDEERWKAERLAEEQAKHSDHSTTPESSISTALTVTNEPHQTARGEPHHCIQSGGFIGAEVSIRKRSHLHREAGRRMWTHICFIDWFYASFLGAYRIHPTQSRCALPLNLDEEDLPDGIEEGNLPAERSWDLPADCSGQRYLFKLGEIIRELMDQTEDGSLCDYDLVLEFDKKFRKMADSWPAYLRIDGKSEISAWVMQEEAVRPYIRSHRILLLQCLTYRILRLHRDYLIQGRGLVFKRYHLFYAALTLSLHLFEQANMDMPPNEESDGIRQDIAWALSSLACEPPVGGFPHGRIIDVHTCASTMIEALLKEEGIRRDVRRAAQRSSKAPDFTETSTQSPVSEPPTAAGALDAQQQAGSLQHRSSAHHLHHHQPPQPINPWPGAQSAHPGPHRAGWATPGGPNAHLHPGTATQPDAALSQKPHLDASINQAALVSLGQAMAAAGEAVNSVPGASQQGFLNFFYPNERTSASCPPMGPTLPPAALPPPSAQSFLFPPPPPAAAAAAASSLPQPPYAGIMDTSIVSNTFGTGGAALQPFGEPLNKAIEDLSNTDPSGSGDAWWSALDKVLQNYL